MTAPALRALRPAATTSAFAGDRLRARAAAPSRVSAISRTRHMAVRVCTVARRAPPRVAASARDPLFSIATATRRAPTAPPRAVRDPGVAVERADDASASVRPGGDTTETKSARSQVAPAGTPDSMDARTETSATIAFERSVPFSRGGDDGEGGAFYRVESALARDLAVLVARLMDTPRVLDAMAGSGVRSARYLKQGFASHVHLNDASPKATDALLATLDALFSPPTFYDDDTNRQPSETVDGDADSVVASSYDDDEEDEEEDFSSSSQAKDWEDCDPSEAEDFASAVRCLPNPSEKPHPFKKTRRGTKTMSRQEKKQLMETKMQKTKLFKLQKVTKKERKMRAEAEAAAAAEQETVAESDCDDDDPEACAIKEAMARAKEEKKKKQRKKRKKKTGSVVSSSVPEDAERDSTGSASGSASEESRDAKDSSGAGDVDSLGTVSVTSKDARRLFASLFGSDAERFDIVDVDSFGSDNFIDDALRVTKLGGYVYATGTDALALCGKNPPRLLSHYGGAFVAPNADAVNETGLRVFVGDAVRRGAAQGMKVTPAFSLFHPHGPVFRAMLKVEKLTGAWDGEEIGFLAQCDACGDARVADKDEVRDGSCFCRRCAKRDADADDPKTKQQTMSVSGPLWLGPLHDSKAVAALTREAEKVDFCGSVDDKADDVPEGQKASAKELLAFFAAEADPALPPFYRRTDELARAGRGLKHGIPPLDAWIAELQKRGFKACRSHVDARGLKSNAPLDDVVAAANAVAAAKS